MKATEVLNSFSQISKNLKIPLSQIVYKIYSYCTKYRRFNFKSHSEVQNPPKNKIFPWRLLPKTLMYLVTFQVLALNVPLNLLCFRHVLNLQMWYYCIRKEEKMLNKTIGLQAFYQPFQKSIKEACLNEYPSFLKYIF